MNISELSLNRNNNWRHEDGLPDSQHCLLSNCKFHHASTLRHSRTSTHYWNRSGWLGCCCYVAWMSTKSVHSLKGNWMRLKISLAFHLSAFSLTLFVWLAQCRIRFCPDLIFCVELCNVGNNKLLPWLSLLFVRDMTLSIEKELRKSFFANWFVALQRYLPESDSRLLTINKLPFVRRKCLRMKRISRIEFLWVVITKGKYLMSPDIFLL